MLSDVEERSNLMLKRLNPVKHSSWSCSGVKRNFWPLRNVWPVIVFQLFCFSK